MNSNDIIDLSIKIVDELVLNGYIQNCIDTDDETEFEVQDIISNILAKKFNVNLND